MRRDTIREHLLGVLEPRRFQRLQVLDDVSFDVRRGEALGHHGAQRLGQEHAAEDHLRRLSARPAAASTPRAAITPILELGVGWNPELDASTTCCSSAR